MKQQPTVRFAEGSGNDNPSLHCSGELSKVEIEDIGDAAATNNALLPTSPLRNGSPVSVFMYAAVETEDVQRAALADAQARAEAATRALAQGWENVSSSKLLREYELALLESSPSDAGPNAVSLGHAAEAHAWTRHAERLAAALGSSSNGGIVAYDSNPKYIAPLLEARSRGRGVGNAGRIHLSNGARAVAPQRRHEHSLPVDNGSLQHRDVLGIASYRRNTSDEADAAWIRGEKSESLPSTPKITEPNTPNLSLREVADDDAKYDYYDDINRLSDNKFELCPSNSRTPHSESQTIDLDLLRFHQVLLKACAQFSLKFSQSATDFEVFSILPLIVFHVSTFCRIICFICSSCALENVPARRTFRIARALR